jgi:putative ABC transport system permease protein
MGAYKSHLVSQFLSESIVLSFISLLIALGLYGCCIQPSTTLWKKIIGAIWCLCGNYCLTGIAVLVGLFAGSYPAFFLSSFQPITVLKGRFKANPQSAWLRKGLVVVQFSISIILIIGTYYHIKQMEFTREETGLRQGACSIGTDQQQWHPHHRERFKTMLQGESDIVSVSAMSGEPGGFHDNFSVDIQRPQRGGMEVPHRIHRL